MKGLDYSFASTEADVKAALAVRLEVFVQEQQVPPEEELDEYDKTARHLVAKEEGRIVATARVYLPSPAEARIGRMAVLKPYRRRGIGRRMLALLCEEAKRQVAAKATLHAQWYARAFYSKYGFTETGEPFMEANIKHIGMEKAL